MLLFGNNGSTCRKMNDLNYVWVVEGQRPAWLDNQDYSISLACTTSTDCFDFFHASLCSSSIPYIPVQAKGHFFEWISKGSSSLLAGRNAFKIASILTLLSGSYLEIQVHTYCGCCLYSWARQARQSKA